MRSWYPTGLVLSLAKLCTSVPYAITHALDTTAAYNVVVMPLLVFGFRICHRGHPPLGLGHYL